MTKTYEENIQKLKEIERAIENGQMDNHAKQIREYLQVAVMLPYQHLLNEREETVSKLAKYLKEKDKEPQERYKGSITTEVPKEVSPLKVLQDKMGKTAEEVRRLIIKGDESIYNHSETIIKIQKETGKTIEQLAEEEEKAVQNEVATSRPSVEEKRFSILSKEEEDLVERYSRPGEIKYTMTQEEQNEAIDIIENKLDIRLEDIAEIRSYFDQKKPLVHKLEITDKASYLGKYNPEQYNEEAGELRNELQEQNNALQGYERQIDSIYNEIKHVSPMLWQDRETEVSFTSLQHAMNNLKDNEPLSQVLDFAKQLSEEGDVLSLAELQEKAEISHKASVLLDKNATPERAKDLTITQVEKWHNTINSKDDKQKTAYLGAINQVLGSSINMDIFKNKNITATLLKDISRIYGNELDPFGAFSDKVVQVINGKRIERFCNMVNELDNEQKLSYIQAINNLLGNNLTPEQFKDEEIKGILLKGISEKYGNEPKQLAKFLDEADKQKEDIYLKLVNKQKVENFHNKVNSLDEENKDVHIKAINTVIDKKLTEKQFENKEIRVELQEGIWKKYGKEPNPFETFLDEVEKEKKYIRLQLVTDKKEIKEIEGSEKQRKEQVENFWEKVNSLNPEQKASHVQAINNLLKTSLTVESFGKQEAVEILLKGISEQYGKEPAPFRAFLGEVGEEVERINEQLLKEKQVEDFCRGINSLNVEKKALYVEAIDNLLKFENNAITPEQFAQDNVAKVLVQRISRKYGTEDKPMESFLGDLQQETGRILEQRIQSEVKLQVESGVKDFLTEIKGQDTYYGAMNKLLGLEGENAITSDNFEQKDVPNALVSLVLKQYGSVSRLKEEVEIAKEELDREKGQLGGNQSNPSQDVEEKKDTSLLGQMNEAEERLKKEQDKNIQKEQATVIPKVIAKEHVEIPEMFKDSGHLGTMFEHIKDANQYLETERFFNEDSVFENPEGEKGKDNISLERSDLQKTLYKSDKSTGLNDPKLTTTSVEENTDSVLSTKETQIGGREQKPVEELPITVEQDTIKYPSQNLGQRAEEQYGHLNRKSNRLGDSASRGNDNAGAEVNKKIDKKPELQFGEKRGGFVQWLRNVGRSIKMGATTLVKDKDTALNNYFDTVLESDFGRAEFSKGNDKNALIDQMDKALEGIQKEIEQKNLKKDRQSDEKEKQYNGPDRRNPQFSALRWSVGNDPKKIEAVRATFNTWKENAQKSDGDKLQSSSHVQNVNRDNGKNQQIDM